MIDASRLLTWLFPSTDRPYYLPPKTPRRYAGLWLCDDIEIVTNECPAKLEHGPGELKVNLLKGYPKGGPVLEILWYPGLIAIRTEWAEKMQAAGFTGIEFSRAQIYKDSSCAVEHPGWARIRCAAVVEPDTEASGMRLKYRCRLCGRERWTLFDPAKGLWFKPCDELPDMFQESLRGGVTFVSERLAEFFMDSGIRPVQLTRFEDVILWRSDLDNKERRPPEYQYNALYD